MCAYAGNLTAMDNVTSRMAMATDMVPNEEDHAQAR